MTQHRDDSSLHRFPGYALIHAGIMARYAAGVNYALVTVIAGEYQRVASFGRSALGDE